MPTNFPTSRFHHRERGQALVFTLVFAAATGIVCLLLFNSGMLANAKTKLQNAADAGAYSAALLEARDHNFSAYANRAMVANQVAVAQFVSLKSYLEDASNTHKRMSNLLHRAQEQIPVSKPFWDLGKAAPIEPAERAFNMIGSLAVQGLDRLIGVLENAQEIHHVATAFDMMLVADEVVKRNDPKAKVSNSVFQVGNALMQVNNWSKSTDHHRANDTSAVADRFADVVVSEESTDAFIRNRLSVPTPSWASTVKLCPVPPFVSSSTAFAFVHAGGTILSENKRRWLGLDATMGAGFASCSFPWLCPLPCVVTVVVPLIDFTDPLHPGGSGGAVAGAGGAYGEARGYNSNPFSTRLYGGALLITPLPGNIRYLATGPGATMDGSGGLQNYYRDMRDPGNPATQPKNQTPEENGGKFPITIEVERAESSIKTSKKLLPGAGLLKLDDSLKDGGMKSLSSAHAYFYRPKQDNGARFTSSGWQRKDGKTEIANLFSPYWQARLVDRSSAEWLLSTGMP